MASTLSWVCEKIGRGLPIGPEPSTGGKLPRVRENIRIYPGWFDEIVPVFLAENPENLSVCHLDADTYEATATVLRLAATRITDETILIFDEFHGFPNWENGEKKPSMTSAKNSGYIKNF